MCTCRDAEARVLRKYIQTGSVGNTVRSTARRESDRPEGRPPEGADSPNGTRRNEARLLGQFRFTDWQPLGSSHWAAAEPSQSRDPNLKEMAYAGSCAATRLGNHTRKPGLSPRRTSPPLLG